MNKDFRDVFGLILPHVVMLELAHRSRLHGYQDKDYQKFLTNTSKLQDYTKKLNDILGFKPTSGDIENTFNNDEESSASIIWRNDNIQVHLRSIKNIDEEISFDIFVEDTSCKNDLYILRFMNELTDLDLQRVKSTIEFYNRPMSVVEA